MKIKLSNAGKRFNREWIFRHAELEFSSGHAYGITGPNGSGKSTLLQTIAGMLQLSEGSIVYSNEKKLGPEELYLHTSFCGPYLDVIEEMTLSEFLLFHNRFKSYTADLSVPEIIGILGLEAAAHKQIRYYSSGMKQRVKLAQAILSDTAIILLDEPCTNLDDKGIELYHALINDYCKERLVIVCSNDPVEYSFCETIVSIGDFKTAVSRQAL